MRDACTICPAWLLYRRRPSFPYKQIAEPGLAAVLQSIPHNIGFLVFVCNDIFKIDVSELCYGD